MGKLLLVIVLMVVLPFRSLVCRWRGSPSTFGVGHDVVQVLLQVSAKHENSSNPIIPVTYSRSAYLDFCRGQGDLEERTFVWNLCDWHPCVLLNGPQKHVVLMQSKIDGKDSAFLSSRSTLYGDCAVRSQYKKQKGEEWCLAQRRRRGFLHY